jgi:8-oxo-dGTP pyrophosphatase MutT (NUDIX family)
MVRQTGRGAGEPVEVYMVRRKKAMKFLGGFYAFPGGKVDREDAADDSLARCCGLTPAEADAILAADLGVPALAYWVAAVRELLEESGVLLAVGADGTAVRPDAPGVAAAIDRARHDLVAGRRAFGEILSETGWRCDLRPLRYLAHFITPVSSPIRFSARFFLCRLAADHVPRLFTEETSEAFWIPAAEGYRRFRAGEMAMAEPAEYALAYLAQFPSLDAVWAAHDDGRHKFEGTVHRIEFWAGFDWTKSKWLTPEGGPAQATDAG